MLLQQAFVSQTSELLSCHESTTHVCLFDGSFNQLSTRTLDTVILMPCFQKPLVNEDLLPRHNTSDLIGLPSCGVL